jgi:hypothetical protein
MASAGWCTVVGGGSVLAARWRSIEADHGDVVSDPAPAEASMLQG